jgi:hypothetical protein
MNNKNNSCYGCVPPKRRLNCHADCPEYTQPEDRYAPRHPSTSEYIDYMVDKKIRRKKRRNR